MNENESLELLGRLKQTYFIPNWFGKEHFEAFIDRKISDEQWAEFLDDHGPGVADYMWQVVADFAVDIADEYFVRECSRADHFGGE